MIQLIKIKYQIFGILLLLFLVYLFVDLFFIPPYSWVKKYNSLTWEMGFTENKLISEEVSSIFNDYFLKNKTTQGKIDNHYKSQLFLRDKIIVQEYSTQDSAPLIFNNKDSAAFILLPYEEQVLSDIKKTNSSMHITEQTWFPPATDYVTSLKTMISSLSPFSISYIQDKKIPITDIILKDIKKTTYIKIDEDLNKPSLNCFPFFRCIHLKTKLWFPTLSSIIQYPLLKQNIIYDIYNPLINRKDSNFIAKNISNILPLQTKYSPSTYSNKLNTLIKLILTQRPTLDRIHLVFIKEDIYHLVTISHKSPFLLSTDNKNNLQEYLYRVTDNYLYRFKDKKCYKTDKSKGLHQEIECNNKIVKTGFTPKIIPIYFYIEGNINNKTILSYNKDSYIKCFSNGNIDIRYTENSIEVNINKKKNTEKIVRGVCFIKKEQLEKVEIPYETIPIKLGEFNISAEDILSLPEYSSKIKESLHAIQTPIFQYNTLHLWTTDYKVNFSDIMETVYQAKDPL